MYGRRSWVYVKDHLKCSYELYVCISILKALLYMYMYKRTLKVLLCCVVCLKVLLKCTYVGG